MDACTSPLDNPPWAALTTAHRHLVQGGTLAMRYLPPGPFGPRTIELGHYIGIRSNSVLAVVAGERMRFGNFTEISAVCTDPAFRGRGLATLLMMRLALRIQNQGLTPILHVFESNTSAIALYERMGFAKRRAFYITVLRAEAAG